MTKDQKIVLIGAWSGIATMALSVAALYRLLPANLTLSDVGSRVVQALQADAIAALPLLLGIVFVANNRFLSEAIDPTAQKEDRATLINGRVLDNTLQQYVLFVIVTLALSVHLAPEQMRLIPAATAVFVVARLAFWIGYRIGPLYRAFGMAATLYLNGGLMAYMLWKMAA